MSTAPVDPAADILLRLPADVLRKCHLCGAPFKPDDTVYWAIKFHRPECDKCASSRSGGRTDIADDLFTLVDTSPRWRLPAHQIDRNEAIIHAMQSSPVLYNLMGEYPEGRRPRFRFLPLSVGVPTRPFVLVFPQKDMYVSTLLTTTNITDDVFQVPTQWWNESRMHVTISYESDIAADRKVDVGQIIVDATYKKNLVVGGDHDLSEDAVDVRVRVIALGHSRIADLTMRLYPPGSVKTRRSVIHVVVDAKWRHQTPALLADDRLRRHPIGALYDEQMKLGSAAMGDELVARFLPHAIDRAMELNGVDALTRTALDVQCRVHSTASRNAIYSLTSGEYLLCSDCVIICSESESSFVHVRTDADKFLLASTTDPDEPVPWEVANEGDRDAIFAFTGRPELGREEKERRQPAVVRVWTNTPNSRKHEGSGGGARWGSTRTPFAPASPSDSYSAHASSHSTWRRSQRH